VTAAAAVIIIIVVIIAVGVGVRRVGVEGDGLIDRESAQTVVEEKDRGDVWKTITEKKEREEGECER
jgi:hypothetical protein